MNIICIDQDTESMVECPVACEPGENRSAIYINEVQHDSESIINIDIPEELSRDYEYETWQMNITISGYNVDNTYITAIKEQTQMTPTNEDVEYLFEWLANYIPILFVGAFIVIVAKIIKKIF